MQIVCDQCQAAYELDPPAAPFVRDQNLVFRCTACGHSIPLKRSDDSSSDSVLDVPDRPDPEAEGFLLRQEGKVYQVRDQAMLQRWIAERRIWRTDEISADGASWVKAEEMDECALFFALVDQAEQGGGSSSSGKGLFARPDAMGDPLSSVSMSSPDPEEVIETPVAEVTSVEAHEEIPVPSDPDEDTSIVEVEASAPLRLAVEALPEEEPASLDLPVSRLSVDEPTMDMDLGEEDFFSEEQRVEYASPAVASGSDDYDEELEWIQTRRKSMMTWWLLFFGALGGAGYFALDFLNQKDVAAKAVPTVAAKEAPVEPPVAEVVLPAQVDGGDSGSAEVMSATEDVPEEEPSAVAQVAEQSEPVVTPSDAPAVQAPAPQATPARVSPSREIDRGWAKIDREDWAGARTHFTKALTADPSNGDAKFGLAYVNENQDRLEEAVRQYCRLQATGSGESKAEAAGRLRALARECP